LRASKLLQSIYIYTALIGLWFVLWLVLGDRTWWLTLLHRVVPYLFLPVLLYAVVLAASHRLRFGLPLLLPCFLFLILYHPYVFPKFPGTDAHGTAELRVMTFNVLYHNLNYDEIAEIILTYRPDLVALQEVQPEMMTALQERLKTPYGFSMMGARNEFGTTAVFSRHPFTRVQILDLAFDRPAVVVNTSVAGKPITFVAAHLTAYGLWWAGLKNIPRVVMEKTAYQNHQAQILLDRIEHQPGIVILGCDCNSKETSSSYRLLDKSLDNAAHEIGWLLSPNEFLGVKRDLDLQHIDYVWYQGELQPVGVYTIEESGGSDHLPVIATFRWH
jgi:vancomycin resistance protein VanJ